MLEIHIDPIELWDERNEEFIQIKGGKLVLEHSLVLGKSFDLSSPKAPFY